MFLLIIIMYLLSNLLDLHVIPPSQIKLSIPPSQLCLVVCVCVRKTLCLVRYFFFILFFIFLFIYYYILEIA